MKALGYFVVIKKKSQTTTKVGNLDLTEAQDDTMRYVIGEVVTFGEGVKGLKEGDEVRYDKRAASEDGDGNYILKSDSIAYVL